jgi:hypothetical protein
VTLEQHEAARAALAAAGFVTEDPVPPALKRFHRGVGDELERLWDALYHVGRDRAPACSRASCKLCR